MILGRFAMSEAIEHLHAMNPTDQQSKVLSPAAIEHLIANGHVIVIFEGHALKLDGWMDKHPGGHLPILHMVARDATDEINA